MRLLHWLLIPPLVLAGELPYPSTLVDALSADEDYSLVLRLIQRAKLVPTLNRLNGSTLFAPTNEAVKKRRKTKPAPSLWDFAFNDDSLTDNIEYELRQHLLYHLLNYTLQDFPSSVTPHKTLHFPRKPLDPPTDDPPPSPPWLPVPGGLLGGEPQRLRLFSKEETKYVGVDAYGSGGAKIVKEAVHTDNGDLYGIDTVVDVPGSLAHEVAQNPSLSIISRFLSSTLVDTLENTPHLTLFFPTDDAWDVLDPIERRYLESGFAGNDLAKIVGLHASGLGPDHHGQIGWSEYWSHDQLTNFTTFEGHTVHVNWTDTSNPTVQGKPIEQRDIYAANGVLHTVSSLLLNPSVFKLNAEKYLLALNATSFVSFLRTANMSHYVDDDHDGKPWTILAPRDDVFTIWNGRSSSLWSEPDGIPTNDTAELQRTLAYHFIPGKLKPEDLEDASLVGTELREQGLKDGRQKLQVSVRGSGKDGGFAWNAGGEIGFGGARVIGDAVEIGDSIIYVISKLLDPPLDAIETSLPTSSYSTFLTSIFSTKLDATLRTSPSTTLLIPQNSAWGELGLVTDFLLLPESREDLKKVVLHHVLGEVVYAGQGGLSSTTDVLQSRTFSTLEGSDIRIESGRIIPSGGWASFSLPVNPVNSLTRTGVIHEIPSEGVLIPRSVEISVGDLAKAGKGSVMIGLVQKAGYGGVLNGTLRLGHEWMEEEGGEILPIVNGRYKKGKGDDKDKKGKLEVGWTLLCPTDDSFKELNLTALLSNEYELKRFVKQHIIPIAPSAAASFAAADDHPARPIRLGDGAGYDTLLTPESLFGGVVFTSTGSNPDSFLVGIKGVKGKSGEEEYAKVLSWGRTTTSSSSSSFRSSSSLPSTDDQHHLSIGPNTPIHLDALRSGVLLISRPLSPYVEGWWMGWGQAVSFGAVGSVVIAGGFYCLVWWWRLQEKEATFEPLGGSEDD